MKQKGLFFEIHSLTDSKWFHFSVLIRFPKVYDC